MFEQTTLFFQRSKGVAEDFLQTTVIVDDQILFGDSAKKIDYAVPADALEEPGRKDRGVLPAKTEMAVDDVQSVVEELGSHDLDAQKVINSFAEKRIVCSVIKPTDNDDWITSVEKLALVTDIIILDWEINKDDGENTKNLLGKVLQSANKQPEQLRLLVIYTAENGIVGVSEEIKAEMKKRLEVTDEKIVVEDDGFALAFGSIRIAVFSKPHTKNLPPEHKNRIVEFEKLADRVTSEFARMTAGLVSNAVLHSLAQIRLNTHKLLKTFSRALDAPYLTHRVMLPDPEDAETLLVSLVAKEIQGIIEESNVGTQGNLDAIKDWLVSQKTLVKIDFNLLNQRIFFDTPEKIVSLLDKGIYQTLEDKDVIPNNISQAQHEKILKELDKKVHSLAWTKSFSQNGIVDEFHDDKFAHITIMRSYYEKSIPKMTLGTILKKNDDSTYWLCLQPRCDCVRIDGNRAFPFLALQNRNQKFSLVAFDNNEYMRFMPIYKPFALRLFIFTSRPEHHGEIVAEAQDLGYYFVDDNNIQYKWLGELKSEQAQRISNEFAANLARVGLDESEWLRLWGTKG